jgi:hypothetical protein
MIEKKSRVFASGIGVVLTAAVGALFGACGGSDDSSLINGTPSDASSVSDVLANGDVTTTPNDSGTTPTDGSVITDGGANFGDGGTGDDGGGDFPDGGTCNRVALGTSIMSDCTALASIMTGGELQNGNYTLTKVTDIGSLTFCGKSFVAVPFQGGLVISSGSGGASDLELALDGDMTGRKSYSWSATPASGNKSPLSIDQSCPTTTTFSLPYTVTAGSAAAKAIEIEAPYGTDGATAIYHFEKD